MTKCLPSLLRSLWDLTKTIALAAFLAFFVIRGFIFEPYRIPSGSMVPTLLVGDFLFVSKFAYGNRLPLTDYFFWQTNPKRGDVVVFKRAAPELPGSFFGLGSVMFIKRLVGMPGDTIAYRDKTLFINGAPVATTPLGDYPYSNQGQVSGLMALQETLGDIQHIIAHDPMRPSLNVPQMTIPADMFVVMGDNRDNSRDSRFWQYPNWGFVPRQDLMGRAEFIWLSLDERWHPRFDRMLQSLRPDGAGV